MLISGKGWPRLRKLKNLRKLLPLSARGEKELRSNRSLAGTKDIGPGATLTLMQRTNKQKIPKKKNKRMGKKKRMKMQKKHKFKNKKLMTRRMRKF